MKPSPFVAAFLAAACVLGGCTDPMKTPPKTAEEFYKDGDFYYLNGNFYRALIQYSQAINRNKDFAAAWAGLGDANRELAVIDFQNASRTFDANQRIGQSKWAFEHALQRDPGLSRALYGMGKLYYEKAVRLADAPVWREEGRAFATPEDRKAWAAKAVEHLQKALTVSPKQEEFYRWAHRYLGILFTLLGRVDEARASFSTFQSFSRETLDFLKQQKPQDEKQKVEVETRVMVLEKDIEDVDALLADLEKKKAGTK